MSRLFADGSTSRESGRELGGSRFLITCVDLTPVPSKIRSCRGKIKISVRIFMISELGLRFYIKSLRIRGIGFFKKLI